MAKKSSLRIHRSYSIHVRETVIEIISSAPTHLKRVQPLKINFPNRIRIRSPPIPTPQLLSGTKSTSSTMELSRLQQHSCQVSSKVHPQRIVWINPRASQQRLVPALRMSTLAKRAATITIQLRILRIRQVTTTEEPLLNSVRVEHLRTRKQSIAAKCTQVSKLKTWWISTIKVCLLKIWIPPIRRN